MSIDTKVRNVRVICAIVATTSIAYAVNYVRKTRDILSHAFDMSIVEEFEEFEPTPKSYSYTTWITPKYETKGIFHQFCSFFKFVYAKRLLNLAKSEDQMLRIRAVKHLAQLNLDEWECAIIAHMCDARTAVGLARSMTNPDNCQKYFLQTPRVYGSYNNQLLLHTIKDFMRLMYKDPNNSPHGCLQKTISKIFLQAYDINRIIDSDHGTEALSYVGKENEDVLPLCLETVRHHSAIPKYSMDVMKYMGLYLLMEVHLRYPDDLNINIPLCQIITNLSTHPELLQEIYKTGWLPVLSKWVFHPDVRISGPASQALTNLDLDSSQDKYSPNIFLLHPRGRSDERILVDVVFVHGLLGSVFYTWRNGRSCSKFLDLVGKKIGHQIGEKESIGLEESSMKDNMLTASSDPAIIEYLQQRAENEQQEWDHLGSDYEIVQFDIPEYTNSDSNESYVITHANKTCLDTEDTQCWARDWLPVDCSHLRVLGVNYATSLSLWAQMCPELSHNVTLEERSNELISELVDAGVGQRPIIWVGHSMGGLLVKNVISKALKSNDPKIKQLANESKAIFFFSTPHAGSKTAILNQTTSYLVWPSMDVQELREDSPNLHRIHNEFLNYLDIIPMKIFSFVENKPTIVSALKLNIEVVEKHSGNPGVGEYYEIPLNHLGICKPTNKQSFLYQKVLAEIRKIVKEEKFQSKEHSSSHSS